MEIDPMRLETAFQWDMMDEAAYWLGRETSRHWCWMIGHGSNCGRLEGRRN